jgi:hypothetical protein
MLLLLAPERLRFGTRRPVELAPPGEGALLLLFFSFDARSGLLPEGPF